MHKLYDNEYGFDVSQNNPFLIFRVLQEYAKESVGEANVIDLSRGDPGYGFTPSVKGRQFFSYLVLLDTYLNNPTNRFLNKKDQGFNQTWQEISDITKTNYETRKAEELLLQFENFLRQIKQITGRSKEGILYEIFKYATVSGGTYHDPQGEMLVKEVLAYQESQKLGTKIQAHEILPTNGANHAIGTTFELLGEEGLNFLKEGDLAAICSPVYAPYNLQLEQRGMNTITFSIDYKTGEIDQESLDALLNSEQRIKLLLIIDPNNPTGFALKKDQLQKLAEVAEKHNSIILTDEVYFNFFNNKESIQSYAPERTIRISALTKIERSAGIRFGYFMLTDKANDYLTTQVLNEYLPDNKDLRKALLFAKAPGGTEGAFQHVTFVPGPMQYLGLCHMVLAQDELKEYTQSVSKNMAEFTSNLELDHDGNMYYIITDLNQVNGCKKQDLPIERKLVDIAKLGVVYIPAFIFFDENVRNQNPEKFLNTIRASVVNTSAENVAKAAQITKKYLTE